MSTYVGCSKLIWPISAVLPSELVKTDSDGVWGLEFFYFLNIFFLNFRNFLDTAVHRSTGMERKVSIFCLPV